MLGLNQTLILMLTSAGGEAADDLPLGQVLANGEAVKAHFRRHRMIGCIQVMTVFFRQLDGVRQPVIQWLGNETMVTALWNRQEGPVGPLQHALHNPFGRTTPSPLTDDFHQNAIPVPSMIQMLVADINIAAATFPHGEAEPLAGATQPSGNQVVMGL